MQVIPNINITQTQSVTQDMTTVNNLFRGESTEESGFWKKLGIELLLSILEPDRFLKNAKAVLLLAAAYMLLQLSFEQIRELLTLYLLYENNA